MKKKKKWYTGLKLNSSKHVSATLYAKMALEINKRPFGLHKYINNELSDKQVRAMLLFENNKTAKKFYKKCCIITVCLTFLDRYIMFFRILNHLPCRGWCEYLTSFLTCKGLVGLP